MEVAPDELEDKKNIVIKNTNADAYKIYEEIMVETLKKKIEEDKINVRKKAREKEKKKKEDKMEGKKKKKIQGYTYSVLCVIKKREGTILLFIKIFN